MTFQKDNTPGVIFPPLLPAAILGVAIVLDFVLPLRFLPGFLSLDWQIAASVAVLVIGFIIAGSALFVFWRARTHVLPFRPTLALVTTGPYRFSRNPMYLAFLFDTGGTSLFFSLEWGLILLPVLWLLLDRLVIAKEEAFLIRKFGADYAALLSRTRRWI